MVKAYKKRAYRKKASKAKSAKPSKGIVRAIHTVIKKSAEAKYASFYQQNQTLNYYTTATSIQTFLITPTIQQGTNDGQRIGNVVHTSKALLRYRLYAPTSGTSPIRLVRAIIVKEKSNPVRNPSTNINTNLFRAERNGTVLGPQNNDLDQMFSINTEAWTVVYDRCHKIGGSGNPATLASNNNDYNQSVMVSVNLQKHFGKIQFDDTTTTPITKNYWIFFLVSDPNGATSVSGTDSGIKLSYDSQITFKDV